MNRTPPTTNNDDAHATMTNTILELYLCSGSVCNPEREKVRLPYLLHFSFCDSFFHSLLHYLLWAFLDRSMDKIRQRVGVFRQGVGIFRQGWAFLDRRCSHAS